MADEGFHEIELKGKQLVFLFMAATVVSVVIFLCGVMVGRGVRAPLPGETPVLASGASVDPTVSLEPAARATAGSASASTQETLTYPGRLDSDKPVAEPLRESAAPASNIPDVPPEPLPEPIPEPRAAAPAARPAASEAPAARAARNAPAEPAGNGFVVQVMAARTRAEADRIAKRLESKGYSAFVTMADGAAPTPFRVRVGKFNTHREAESMAQRLKKEEQFNTWITR